MGVVSFPDCYRKYTVGEFTSFQNDTFLEFDNLSRGLAQQLKT